MDAPRDIFVRKNGVITDSPDHDPAALSTINIDETTARGKPILGNGGIQVDNDTVITKDSFELEKFMQDVLLVHFHEPADENEPQFAEVTVNGEYRSVLRGTQARLKRMHVAVLANAKQLRVQQKKIVNADGSMGFIEQPVMKLTYPFAVQEDPSPRGSAWLTQLLRNPA